MKEILILNLTKKCNEKCKYCYESIKRKYRQEILKKCSIDENLLDISKNSKIKNIIFTGGEALLYLEIEKIFELFNKKKITLLTNGINKPLDNIKKYIKNINVVISLDGNNRVMMENRNTSEKDFYSILKNIDWYIENSNSVTIQTVITKNNLNEKSYFPFEIFKEKINYTFSVPSHIFSPKEFILLENKHKIVKNKILKYIEKYDYHLNCKINLFRKDTFLQNLEQKINEMIIPEFFLENNTYYLLNTPYSTLDEVFCGINKKIQESKKILIQYLEDKKNNYIFDPYCRLEYELFKKYKGVNNV